MGRARRLSATMSLTLGRRPSHSLIGLMAVAGLCFALWSATLCHSDDGCLVELHCFACQWALSGKVDLVLPLPPVPAIAVGFHAPVSEPPSLGICPAPRLESRGPPAA
jgi:hypothetical protein